MRLLLGGKPTWFEVFLAGAWLRVRAGIDDPSGALTLASLRDPETPLQYYVFLAALTLGWCALAGVFGLLEMGVWGALYGLHVVGHGILLTTLIFTSTFCFVGAGDALWRSFVAWSAHTRWRRAVPEVGYAGALDFEPTTRRLLRIARFNDWTLVIQLAAAAVSVTGLV